MHNYIHTIIKLFFKSIIHFIASFNIIKRRLQKISNFNKSGFPDIKFEKLYVWKIFMSQKRF
ncbi:hypothetical protein ACM39_05860 [Chryseobacterium sp. FH2]|nr:hypothetical protein ACM39_05860 [Chryseobacterium sp. FH2]